MLHRLCLASDDMKKHQLVQLLDVTAYNDARMIDCPVVYVAGFGALAPQHNTTHHDSDISNTRSS